MMQDSDRSAAIPLFALGFRPFFLGAAAFAALGAALWAAAYLDWLGDFAPRGGWLAWHLREMPFGFACAVIAGFVLTAVQNWTGSPGLRGAPLMGLFGLWVAARIAWLWPAIPVAWAMAAELLFLPAVAVRVAWQLRRVHQRRNYPLVGLLVLLAMADAMASIAQLQQDFVLLRQAAWAALWLIGAVIVLIGGRIIPAFTANGLRLAAPVSEAPWLPRSAIVSLLLLAILAAQGIALAPDPRWVPLFGVITAVHGWRAARWFHPGILRVPLLWSLHLGHLWLVVALGGLTAWHAGLLANGGAALHAFTIGGVGGLILAMMARVSLGHTARPLSPPGLMTIAFLFVALSAGVRVALIGPAPLFAVAVSAGFWCAGFLLFIGCYAPMLFRPRLDGRAG